MNLHSPLFDAVRIPPRRTPDMIAAMICQEHGVEPDSLKDFEGGRRTKLQHAVSKQVAQAMRDNHISWFTIMTWFGANRSTIREWIDVL